MGNFINRLFYKNKCVKCFVFDTAGRCRIYWLIPATNDTVIIEPRKEAYHLNVQDRFYSKGTPSWFFNTNNTEPFNPYTHNQTVNTPDQEAVALNAHVTRELFTAFKSKFDLAVLPVIACVLLAIVVGVVAYMGSERLTELYDKIVAIQDLLASGY